MRCGISMVSKRHAKANKPYFCCSAAEGAAQQQENNYKLYYDANNLYDWAMSQPLPYSGFKWIGYKKGTKRLPGKGWILEVDLEQT